ncbi:manganese-dependent inorganic pyrophosphatase [Aerococcaceae bacterium DSM 111176]|nr:manganese-dependent inorganic pyrophosphatase [Aerococcaceae bacterium DSM 111176]
MSKYLVFGHQNPDTDAIGSAIAFSYYLERTGNTAEPVALGEPNSETAYALNHFSLEAPRVVETVANEVEHVALVDHNEPQQSVADLADVTVDYVVDHHRISGFNTANPLFYRAEPIGSTCSVIYKMFTEQDIDIPQSIAGIMLSAIISDTLLLKSPTTTSQDKDIAEALAKIANVDLQAYGIDMLKASADISQQSDAELVNSDAKSFELNGHNVRIGQVNVIGFEDILERKAGLLNVMESEVKDNDFNLFLLVITDILENDSIGLVAGENHAMVTEAFDAEITDAQIDLPGVVSRKKQVVPPLTDAYDAL